MELFLNEDLGKISFEINEAESPKAVLIIAHGAGAGMHHAFLTSLAGLFAEAGITTVRFNFPYMEAGKKFSGSPKKNIQTWKLVVEEVFRRFPDLDIFISGKSYGGRMASHLLADHPDLPVKGIIYFGFPLHAPGKDSTDRAKHLSQVKVPQLFLQGEVDKLANIEMMREVVAGLSPATLEEFSLADHSFKVPKSSGLSADEIMNKLVRISLEWVHEIAEKAV